MGCGAAGSMRGTLSISVCTLDGSDTPGHPAEDRGRRIQLPYGPPAPGPTSASLGVQNALKIHPKRVQNPLKKCLGEVLGRSWRGLGEVWEALGGLLGASWPQDGTKSQKDPHRTPDGPPTDPHWTPKLEAKINEKSILRASKI